MYYQRMPFCARITSKDLLFLVLIVSLGDYLDEFDALIIHDFQLSSIWVSVILMIRFSFIALGNILAPLVQKRITSTKQIVVLDGLACVFILVFTILWNQYALVLFGLSLMGMSITEILMVNTLQNEIKEEGRATIMSFYGIGQNVVMVHFSLIYALLAGIVSLQLVYIIISFYGVMGGISLYLILRQK